MATSVTNPSVAQSTWVQLVGTGAQYSNTADAAGSKVIKATDGFLVGVFVASTSSGTFKLWDNATAGSGSVVVNTTTPAAATYYPIPARFTNGLYLTLTNTIDITVFYI